MAPPVLHLQHVHFRWPGGTRDLLHLPEFVLESGERVFLQGPSGSGKSTLLSLVGGILLAHSGSVEVLGQDLSLLSSSRRDAFRVAHLGFLFQLFNLLPYLSLTENVLLPLRFSRKRAERVGSSGTWIPEAERLLQALGLGEPLRNNRPVTELSVGQQQRVAAARALIGRPELIIADEPTSALDADAREDFLELLFRESGASGSALLFVSHDADLGLHFDRQLSLAELNHAASASGGPC
jgi:putative ABC transport system ATP-binding protein